MSVKRTCHNKDMYVHDKDMYVHDKDHEFVVRNKDFEK